MKEIPDPSGRSHTARLKPNRKFEFPSSSFQKIAATIHAAIFLFKIAYIQSRSRHVSDVIRIVHVSLTRRTRKVIDHPGIRHKLRPVDGIRPRRRYGGVDT